jgi:hypothetical protein
VKELTNSDSETDAAKNDQWQYLKKRSLLDSHTTGKLIVSLISTLSQKIPNFA